VLKHGRCPNRSKGAKRRALEFSIIREGYYSETAYKFRYFQSEGEGILTCKGNHHPSRANASKKPHPFGRAPLAGNITNIAYILHVFLIFTFFGNPGEMSFFSPFGNCLPAYLY
jgi:hypothetical protein